MEESKELQGFYKIFRAVVYVSVLLEFFEYAIDPAVFDQWGGILTDIHGRIKRWTIYQDGHLVYSKIATILLICITCIGTRNKKHLEFNARKQVIFPLTGGLLLLVLSVWLFGHPMEMRLYTLPLNRILYMAASLVGVILVHIALDNISKFIKEGLMKDRFNFENESFEQSEEIQENKYSVNIPMRYYYKGKFQKVLDHLCHRRLQCAEHRLFRLVVPSFGNLADRAFCHQTAECLDQRRLVLRQHIEIGNGKHLARRRGVQYFLYLFSNHHNRIVLFRMQI